MARGAIKQFSKIFEENDDQHKNQSKQKGRSKQLHNKRNECLVDRYYYYGKLEERQRLKILESLSSQFFISIVTIPELIDENYEYLVKLKKMQPNKEYFKKKWPHLVWS
jgi:ferric iron reductase protein FhuF